MRQIYRVGSLQNPGPFDPVEFSTSDQDELALDEDGLSHWLSPLVSVATFGGLSDIHSAGLNARLSFRDGAYYAAA